MVYIYFVQLRTAGYSIKICETGDCPYVRLNNLRSSMHNRNIELLGAIAIRDAEYHSCQHTKDKIQSEFEGLRDGHKKGDWFLPGIQMVTFIQEHARPHFCDRSCSGGTTIEEDMRALDRAAGEAIAKARSANAMEDNPLTPHGN